MKLKNTLIFIITIFIMFYPTIGYTWVQNTTYEACNIVNMIIAGVMRLISVIIAISYITIAIAYIRYSEKEKKAKNIVIWLIITIIQIIILIFGATLVTEIGMETYTYPQRERYQSTEIGTGISNSIRAIALVSIIVYIIKSISYFKKSNKENKENKEKIIKLIKWQLITWLIVAGLLLFARIW